MRCVSASGVSAGRVIVGCDMGVGCGVCNYGAAVGHEGIE